MEKISFYIISIFTGTYKPIDAIKEGVMNMLKDSKQDISEKNGEQLVKDIMHEAGETIQGVI